MRARGASARRRVLSSMVVCVVVCLLDGWLVLGLGDGGVEEGWQIGFWCGGRGKYITMVRTRMSYSNLHGRKISRLRKMGPKPR